MTRIAAFLAKAAIAFGLALTIAIQALIIPLLAQETVSQFPEAEYLRLPGIVGCIAIVACVQVVLVCTWLLLTRVTTSRIFAREALRAVDTMVGACVAAALLFALAFAILGNAAVGGPGVMLMILAGGGASLTGALVLGVMRSLLTQATAFKSELAEVV